MQRFTLLLMSSLLLAACGGNGGTRAAQWEPAPPQPVAPQPINNGSIYQSATAMPLFQDPRAHRVGDLLTVQLVEQTQASKSASTSTGKEQTVDLPNPTILGIPQQYNGMNVLENAAEASRDFTGDGSSSQSNSLSGSITVTVAEVLPNGNLVIRGQKLLTLNQGQEYVRISGIVRAVDVTPENTVLSTQVANAEISYSGDGAIHDANRMGWLARFFNSKYWPF